MHIQQIDRTHPPRMHPHRTIGRVAAVSGLLVSGVLMLTGCGAPDTAQSAESADAEAPIVAAPVVEVEELGEGTQANGMHLDFEGPVQVNFRKITIPPGEGTGEHCHDGNLIAVVEQGTLTHYASVHPGGVREYHAGDSIFEGNGYPHEGRNEGDTDVVLLVTYVTPDGHPLAETDLSLCTLTPGE